MGGIEPPIRIQKAPFFAFFLTHTHLFFRVARITLSFTLYLQLSTGVKTPHLYGSAIENKN